MSPPAKRAARPATTIDDLLREILVRLPELPSLLRAALACPAFLRALGFFIDSSSIPTFVPLRRRNDPDLAAAVRGGDFFLTRLPDLAAVVQGDAVDADDDSDVAWEIQGCRGGYLLLLDRIAHEVAAYNPLTRSLDLFPQPPVDENEIPGEFFGEFHIFSDEQNPGSFRVFGIYEDDGVHVTVFSSDSKRWQALAWPETPTPESWVERVGVGGNKFMYWRHASKPYMTVLNTETLQFSRMDLPPALRLKVSGKGHSHRSTLTAGETKDGAPCIFEVCGNTLCVWLWISGDDGVGSWVSEDDFSFEEENHGRRDPWEHGFATKSLRQDAVTVAAAVDGFVYLHTNTHPCSFMSLCLQTGELRKLKVYEKASRYHQLHPYIMAWPPLTGDRQEKGRRKSGEARTTRVLPKRASFVYPNL